MFVCRTQNQNCGQILEKNSKLKADLVSVNQGGVPEKGSSDILWQLTHTERFCLFLVGVWNLHPFSQVNRLFSLHNGHIKTLNAVSVNVSSVAATLHLFQSSGWFFQLLDNCSSRDSTRAQFNISELSHVRGSVLESVQAVILEIPHNDTKLIQNI